MFGNSREPILVAKHWEIAPAILLCPQRDFGVVVGARCDGVHLTATWRGLPWHLPMA